MSSGDAGSPSWSGARERIEALEGWAGLQRTLVLSCADQFSDPVQPSGAFSFLDRHLVGCVTAGDGETATVGSDLRQAEGVAKVAPLVERLPGLWLRRGHS